MPVTLTAEGEPDTSQSLQGFKASLQRVLRSPRTKQIVEAIMAQAMAMYGPVEAGK
jgi:hypothetical protein